MLTLVNQLASEKNNALVGQKVEILCEGASKTNSERLSGRTMQNKIVIIEGDQQRLTGEFSTSSLPNPPAILSTATLFYTIDPIP
ncbi:MAG: TRAM domain-containing protein [Verrucomicrobiales bacterium]